MRTITVKGIGSVSTRPDYVQVLLELDTLDKNYEIAMGYAAEKIDRLNRYLARVGFGTDSIKTTKFEIETDYSSQKDGCGNYHRVFNGYRVRHNLKLGFDFDTERLSHALTQISICGIEAKIWIRFTVKEPSTISERLLASAAENARRTAEILCTASGAKLGDLQQINYNWVELDIYSHTEYGVQEVCSCKSIEFTPDDIETTDTASFIWEII